MEPKPSSSPYNTPPPGYSEAINLPLSPTPTDAPIRAGVAPSGGMVQPQPQPQQQQFVVHGAQFAPVQQGTTAEGQPIFIVHGPPPQRIHQDNNHYCLTSQRIAAARRKKMIVSFVIVIVSINIIIAVTVAIFAR